MSDYVMKNEFRKMFGKNNDHLFNLAMCLSTRMMKVVSACIGENEAWHVPCTGSMQTLQSVRNDRKLQGKL
jgi:hypothetical protein